MPRPDNSALARKHFGLVHACCKRFAGKGIEYEELFQAGCLGLTKALNRFEQDRGLQFSTYAFPVIMGEIKRLFRDGGAVRVSRSLRELSVKIARLNENSVKTTGRELTVSELSEQLQISAETVTEALNSTQAPLSLTSGFDEDGNPQLDVPVEDIAPAAAERLSLRDAIGALEKTDRKIINLRYYQCKTQVQTAGLLQMSQVQISRREKKILAQIRAKMSG